MEVILNELSVADLSGTPDVARQKMEELLQLCKKAKEEIGCNGLRLPNAGFFEEELVPEYTLNRWLIDKEVSMALRTLFNGLRRYPFLEEMTEEEETQFVNFHFFLNEPAHHSHRKIATGLANAWIKKTLAVSFCSHDTWSKCKVGITIENVWDGPYEEKVYNACSEACFNDEFKEWFRKAAIPDLRTHADVDVWFSPENYQLSDQAKNDLILMFSNNQLKLIDEIESLIKEIWIDPRAGTGKPETLKGDWAGWMSRRISGKHRLVYKLEGDILHINSCYDHYDDK